jgi:DNA-binding NtrC family response regulator
MSKGIYPPEPVLLIDDEAEGLRSLELALRSGGIRNILQCRDSREVLGMMSQQEVSTVLLDLRMPFISGEDLLPMITQDHPDTPVIVITATNDVQTAVKCMQAKAFDYMVKPVEKSRLISGVRRAVELKELQKEYLRLKHHMLSQNLQKPDAFSGIITQNKQMYSLFRYAESIAVSPHPVLITGETGVGKELMAKAIYGLLGPKGPFLSVNVAGIDDNVFSDTLFGHKKGAFTGAVEARKGLVERASGGLLHLDEIGDLSPDSQIKLLRLLEEREFFPLGSDMPKMADVRIIVSTNHDLQTLQSSGRFRKDLYYRLRAHHIQIPPLRERMDDLPLLIEAFVSEAAKILGRKKPTVPRELLSLLSGYGFPGNIRELKSMIVDSVTSNNSARLSTRLFEAHIGRKFSRTASDYAGRFSFPHCPTNIGSGRFPTLKEATCALAAEAMSRTGNNQSMAARLLGISRQRLARYLKGNVS